MPDRSPEDGALRASMGPDPSPLSTRQVVRENFWLRELIETRLDGMDKAIALLQAAADRVPTLPVVDANVKHLKELVEQRFQDSKTALDAAMTSQSKAIDKQENAFAEQISGMERRQDADKKTNDEKYTDLKERFNVYESKRKGGSEMWGLVVGGIGMAVAVVTLIILFVKTAS